MSDWDKDSDQETPAKTTIVPKKSKWEGEDEEDGPVASDWEASSDDEAKGPAKPASNAAPPRKKGTLKAKIAEKEAEKAARADQDDLYDEDAVLDPREKARRDRERELEADLANANDLLGTAEDSKPELSTLLSANPKTKEEFAAYSSQIVELLIQKHQNKPLYAVFVEGFVKELAQPLKDIDVRKAASVLTTLANEKQKEKTATKKKPKGAAKPALGLTKAGGRLDTTAYEESLDDFGREVDDFM